MGVVTRRRVSHQDAPGRYDHEVERRWALDASDVVSLVAGLIFGVMGLIALVELGFSDFPSEATTDVFGITHTQLWGIADVVLALLFLAAIGSMARGATVFAGAVALVVGIVVLVAADELDPVLATEDAWGWLAAIVGTVVLLAAILIPTVATRHDVADEVY